MRWRSAEGRGRRAGDRATKLALALLFSRDGIRGRGIEAETEVMAGWTLGKEKLWRRGCGLLLRRSWVVYRYHREGCCSTVERAGCRVVAVVTGSCLTSCLPVLLVPARVHCGCRLDLVGDGGGECSRCWSDGRRRRVRRDLGGRGEAREELLRRSVAFIVAAAAREWREGRGEMLDSRRVGGRDIAVAMDRGCVVVDCDCQCLTGDEEKSSLGPYSGRCT
ncbi:hypothetical protein Q3G72_021686 [Acer saccharum]|nr:hypothetical protein Q3G72_021686 [Acer saccharum]